MNAFILDIGSCYVKCGTSNHQEPFQFPSCVSKQYFPSTPDTYQEILLQESSNVEFFNEKIFENGRLNDLDLFPKILDKCLEECQLGAQDPIDFLFPQYLNLNYKDLKVVSQAIFEKSKLQNLFLPPQTLCVLSFYGSQTGCVLEVGDSIT